jgi:hypothetical protein
MRSTKRGLYNRSQTAADLGAVYTCDFVYEMAYDSVYDLLPSVSNKLNFYLFLLKCVDRNEKLDPYLASMQNVHGTVRRFVRRFGHV